MSQGYRTSHSRVVPGLENCLMSPPDILADGGRFGLLLNQASVDTRFRYACDVLAERFPGQLACLFSPQHGLWSSAQDNMIETPHGRHPRLQVPIYSLYAEQRQPSPDMLAGLDCLVIDLQDVGTRVYTYIWTVTYCLETCARAGVPVVILDRPNPLGGRMVEGPLLQADYTSFIGRAPIPMRHGLTLGELALFLNRGMGIEACLDVVPMQGWRRSMLAGDTGLAWVPPSPNLPRSEGAAVYPGMVLIEGTQLSEGRGTTTPFEVVGAPFIDAFALADALTSLDMPGFVFRPITFRPTFQKWRERECGGVFIHLTDPVAARPYAMAVHLLRIVHDYWPNDFRWLSPPYEYEETIMPIDILSGSSALREAIETASVPACWSRLVAVDEDAWWATVADALLYA